MILTEQASTFYSDVRFQFSCHTFFSCRTKNEQSSHVCFGVVVFFFSSLLSFSFNIIKIQPSYFRILSYAASKVKKKKKIENKKILATECVHGKYETFGRYFWNSTLRFKRKKKN